MFYSFCLLFVFSVVPLIAEQAISLKHSFEIYSCFSQLRKDKLMFAVFKATPDVTPVLPVSCSMLNSLRARTNFSANRSRPSFKWQGRSCCG